LEARTLERLGEDASVERRRVRDQHAPLEQLGERAQRILGRGRLVDHRLADAGEALDPAPERLLDLHE